MGIESSEECPKWLLDFVSKISSLLNPLGFIGQLGFRYLSPDADKNKTKRWLLAVYIVPHELSGGKHDGSSVVSGFCLNPNGLLEIFSEVSTLEWRVPRGYTDGLDGPEVWLEGTYAIGVAADHEKQVQLHIYSEPPADEAPAIVLDVNTNTLRTK